MALAPAIVVVDDEAYQRRVLVELLARHGLRATAPALSAELKAAARSDAPWQASIVLRRHDASSLLGITRLVGRCRPQARLRRLASALGLRHAQDASG
jgi:CheY-like chemotaxis protein